MKGSFQISLISILFILLGFCNTELHWNYHWNYHSTLTLCNSTTRSDLNSLNGHYRSKYGQNYDIVTGTRNSSNPRICKYRYGRQRLSFNQLRVFNYRGLFDRESLSETHGSWFKERHSGSKWNSERPTTRPHSITTQRGAWCICHSAGYCSLATRITNSQCYVYQQGSEGQRQWHIEWKENNQTFGLYYSSVAAVVHLYISKASEIHTTHQKICSDGSNAKCSSFHFYGSIACGSTYQHSRINGYCHTTHQRKTWNQQGQ